MANQQIKKFKKPARKEGVPQLSRADEIAVLDWLHAAAKRSLFGGKGSWPADDETKRTYWFLFKQYLSISFSDEAWYLTKFAQEIDVCSLGAFIGVDLESDLSYFDWDEAGEAELEDLFDYLLEENVGEERADERTKQYLRGAYTRYCAAHGIRPCRQLN